MIKYIIIAAVLIPTIIYEIWNQKKNRESEWYLNDLRTKEQDFHHKVLTFLSELRTEPENTRRMLRKLSFDDVETKLKNELQSAREEYYKETSKGYSAQDRDSNRISNLAGKMDGLNYALSIINESKPKSYKQPPKETDPTMPNELQSIYYSSLKKMMDDYRTEIERDNSPF